MADDLTPEQLVALANQLTMVAGRIANVIILRGDETPSNTFGAPGSSAFNADTRTWYGPKDAVTGWGPGSTVTQGPPGPAGAKGDTGDTGATGPKGDTGDTGAKGDQGDTGAEGPEGPQGSAGAKGETGDQGPQGVSGPKGDTGDTGPKGDTGDAGPKGDKGDRGDAFTVNAQGTFAGRAAYDSEPVGFSYLVTDDGDLYFRISPSGWSPAIPFGKGEKGDPGEEGPAGADGATGAKGDQGDPGPKGDQGDPGPKGDAGDAGPKGDQGDTGSPGSDATVAFATGADLRALTDDAKFLTAKSVADAAAVVALTDAPTVAVDMATGVNFTVTLGGNRTLGAPSNAKPGTTGSIHIKQPASGGPSTMAYASAWLPFGATPALSTAANAVDLLTWIVETSGKVRFTLQKGGAA